MTSPQRVGEDSIKEGEHKASDEVKCSTEALSPYVSALRAFHRLDNLQDIASIGPAQYRNLSTSMESPIRTEDLDHPLS